MLNKTPKRMNFANGCILQGNVCYKQGLPRLNPI